MTETEPTSLWIQRLGEALAGPTSEPFSVVETHISWVLLVGPFAWKIKKPVRFAFLDFSTLDLRRQACTEEFRLNRRFAPELYLGVVPIHGTAAAPSLAATSQPVIEWAVQMRRFPQEDQLDHRLAAGLVSNDSIVRFGRDLAAMQRSMPAATPDSEWGATESVRAQVRQNVDELCELCDRGERDLMSSLRRWSDEEFERIATSMDERKVGGFVREGHGDLHLANLVWWRDRVLPFDCIEFDANLRWSDVVADVAFLFMDLSCKGRRDLAYRFLDGWLEATGDGHGLRLLRYWTVHRALVRAKVAAITRRSGDASRAAAARGVVDAYLAFAESESRNVGRGLVLMHGLSGSGKSTVSAELCATLPAVRVRSDVERRRVGGLDPHASSGSAPGAGLYDRELTRRTYVRMEEVVTSIASAGRIAIVDATFLQRAARDRFRELADRLRVPFLIVDCDAPVDELRRRLLERGRSADVSEADAVVLDWQLGVQEPLTDAERRCTVAAEAPGTSGFSRLTKSLLETLERG